jgi:polysaccharide deacetylase 2 family uncharacterized protein YibQ
MTSDRGRVLLYRHLHLGSRSELVRIVGKRVQEGLAAARVPHEQIRQDSAPGPDGGTPSWLISLPAEGSALQVNYQVTEAVRRGGADVTSAHEKPGHDGATEVIMEIGFPGRTLHELRITRPGRAGEAIEEKKEGRIALLLVELGPDDEARRTLLARSEPFAVGVPAIGPGRGELRKQARAGGHELVLQVPMEPENYPRINPGPGTLLVSMPGPKIERALHEDISEAGNVVAVSNYMGSFASQDEPFMTAFYRELRRSNQSFLHVQPVPRAVCRELAASVGVAYDEPDYFLDREARESKPAALDRAWKAIRDHAQKRGQAIVVIRATPTSEAWLAHALTGKAMDGVTLVPLSQLLHHAGTE